MLTSTLQGTGWFQKMDTSCLLLLWHPAMTPPAFRSRQKDTTPPPPPLHTHTHTTPPLRKLNCNSPDSSPHTVSLPFVPWLYGLSLPIYFSPPFDDGLGNLTYVALQEVNINDITRRLKWVCSPWFALLYLCHRHEKSVSKLTAGSRGEEEAHGE